MTREEALQVFGLSEKATEQEIRSRYDLLFRKFKSREMDEKGRTRADVEAAYRLLLGLDYIDKEAERLKRKRQEKPNRLLMLLKLDPDKVSNFFYYNTWKMVLAVVIVAVVVWGAVSLANRVEPNLKILFAGNLVLMEYGPMEQAIDRELEGDQAVQVQAVTLNDQLDAQMRAVSEQKLSLELMEGENDLYIMDIDTYRYYAAFGVFKPLNGLVDELGIKAYDKEKLEVAIVEEDGPEHEPMLYGMDISNNSFLREYGVMGESLVVSLGIESKNEAFAMDLYKKLIESVP